jgi:FixJ family two-component response regulator
MYAVVPQSRHETRAIHSHPPAADTERAPVVFVVDDDASICRSLALLIQSAGWHVETFACAHQFLASPWPLSPSCLVLDVQLPGLNGLELQQRLSVDRKETPIVFITGHGDVPTTVRAMKGGAVDVLTKPFCDTALLNAISDAIERSRTELERRAALRSLSDRYTSLSGRERGVMALVVSGKLNKQVGAELGISEITVKAHRGRVMRKMQATSLPALVNMAARLALTLPPDR